MSNFTASLQVYHRRLYIQLKRTAHQHTGLSSEEALGGVRRVPEAEGLFYYTRPTSRIPDSYEFEEQIEKVGWRRRRLPAVCKIQIKSVEHGLYYTISRLGVEEAGSSLIL